MLVQPRVLARRLSRLRLTWWPSLGAAAALVLIALASVLAVRWPAGMRFVSGRVQRHIDATGPFLVAVATALYAAKAALTRNRLYLIMAAFSATLVCREIHFGWTHRGVYVMLAVVGVWAFAWRKQLAEPLQDRRHTSWIVATVWAYVLAFLVYRRVFRFVPGEAQAHNFIEESMETVAHGMLIATALLGSWRRRRAAKR